MLTNKKGAIFVLIIILIQCIFINSYNFADISFPYLHGIPINSSITLEYKLLLYWYLPIAAISFYFSGYFKKNLNSYGNLLIVREFSRVNWILQRYRLVIKDLLFFVSFQILIFGMITLFFDGIKSIDNSLYYLLSMYFLMILILISFQLFLELHVSSELAHFIINIYIVLSVILTRQFYETQSSKIIYYLFVPNYGMGYRTGLSNFEGIEKYLITFPTGLVILLCTQIAVLLFSIKKIKTMDLI